MEDTEYQLLLILEYKHRSLFSTEIICLKEDLYIGFELSYLLLTLKVKLEWTIHDSKITWTNKLQNHNEKMLAFI